MQQDPCDAVGAVECPEGRAGNGPAGVEVADHVGVEYLGQGFDRSCAAGGGESLGNLFELDPVDRRAGCVGARAVRLTRRLLSRRA